MNNPPPVLIQPTLQPLPLNKQRRFPIFLLAIAAVILAFSRPLIDLLTFASHSELYSHVILIPLISLYLVWLKRGDLSGHSAPSRLTAALAFVVGAVTLAGYWNEIHSGTVLAIDDRLAFLTLAFVAFIIGVCAIFLGRRALFAIGFPLGFLLFMVPFPLSMMEGIETFFQHTSAIASAGFFKLAGTPFFRNETFFQLPGINLQVAPECSGIRSSLALFITSLVAGHLFLRSPYKRALLACVVIPLGILRNGFRILVIGELCVHVSPTMIDSPIHHKGGPIFFALSLVPFSLFLWLLVRSDGARRKNNGPVNSVPTPSAPVTGA